jgi:hypothetical protein
MLRRVNRQGMFRYVCLAVVILLCLSFISFFPSTRVNADASVTCNGNNLAISWSGLNPPVTVRVNGADAVTDAVASGSTLILVPVSWSVEVLQNGDLVGAYSASCPGGVQ